MSIASVEYTICGLLYRYDRVVTAICDDRWFGFEYFRNTLHMYSVIGRNFKVLGCHMIGVSPKVISAVDLIVIDVCSVAAAVDDVAGVGARFQSDICTAVGDDRQGGGMYFGETMYGRRVVLRRRESVRVEGVSVGPNGVVSGAVGVAVAEGDCACSVARDVGGAVHEDGHDGPAADVGDGVG